MIKQKSHLEVEIAGKQYTLICDSDSPLGSLHDALMQMKGWAVDRMIKNQKEEQEVSEHLQVEENEIPLENETPIEV